MKKFSSKALLSALSAVGTIATLGITAGTAHASVVSAATVTIPQELGSGSGVVSVTTVSNSIVYNPGSAPSNATVIVNVSGGSLNTGSYTLVGPGVSCPLNTSNPNTAVPAAQSITFSCLGSAPTGSYTLEVAYGTNTSTPSVTFVSVSNAPVIVSISSQQGNGSGAATVFTPAPELNFTSSSSTYNISANQINFTNNSSNSATNSISMTDNYNPLSWAGYINSGTINFVFSNIPSSVTSVSTASTVTTGNTQSVSFNNNTVTPSNSSATLSGTINPSSSNLGSAAYSFSFINSGNIATGTINVAVNGSNLSGIDRSISSTTNGSYSWLGPTAFVTFANSTANIYGELVYLNSAAMSTYSEELRLVLPYNVSASNVSISLGGNSCGNLSQSQYVSSSVSSGTNQTTYNLNVANLFTNCLSGVSYNVGDLVPIQISFSLPSGANISQVSGVAFAWGNSIYKRLPLNVVYGQASHLTY